MGASKKLSHGLLSQTGFDLEKELIRQLCFGDKKAALFKVKIDIGHGMALRLENIGWFGQFQFNMDVSVG